MKPQKCTFLTDQSYIIILLIYTNDLLQNPSEPILLGTDNRAVQCVEGLAKISHWTGVENLYQTDFYIAAPIVAYNINMNVVDHMDQYCSTLATQQREKQVHLTVFTYIMDLSITQAYAVYQRVALECQDPTMSYFTFSFPTLCSPFPPKDTPNDSVHIYYGFINYTGICSVSESGIGMPRSYHVILYVLLPHLMFSFPT